MSGYALLAAELAKRMIDVSGCDEDILYKETQIMSKMIGDAVALELEQRYGLRRTEAKEENKGDPKLS